MDWPLAFLIVTLTITLFGFLWGIIKIFKKPHEDKSWKEPLDELKKEIKQDNKECQQNIHDDIVKIKSDIISHGNKIHDLEKDKDMLIKSMDELKGVVNAVSGKCDTILDKVIEYMKKD